jgi:outer membrane biosynthesis protein TonB
MTKIVVTLACAAALVLAYPTTRAAAQAPMPSETKPATSETKPATPDTKPTTTETKPEGEGTKPEANTAKPEEAAPSAAPTPETEAADGETVSLGELTKDGFEIRATDFIPAEAVTRHSGKVSSDAVVVTLQKTTATAVCFYTLKAYVGKKLTTIPACTVHR